MKNMIAMQRSHYADKSKEAETLTSVGLASHDDRIDKRELAAWMQLMRVVLNLHETVTRY